MRYKTNKFPLSMPGTGAMLFHFQKASFCQMKSPESKIFQYSSVLTMDMPLDYHTSE